MVSNELISSAVHCLVVAVSRVNLMPSSVKMLSSFFFVTSEVLLDGILNRMPVLETAQVRQLTNGPESFTPDKFWCLGQSAEVSIVILQTKM